MKVWVIKTLNPLPLDSGSRPWRTELLARVLVAMGHEVVWFSSSFSHAQKRHRFDGPRSFDIAPNLRLELLYGAGYNKNISAARYWSNISHARAFRRTSERLPGPDVIHCALPTLELCEAALSYAKPRN